MMTDLTASRQQVLGRIKKICQESERSEDSITLLAVSKMQSSEQVRAMYAAGQKYFAENYLQEALTKQSELTDLPIEWHFIGQIQRNKTRDIAAHFAWVHGVDRLIIAQRLAQHRQDDHRAERLNICIQVNIDREETKGGCLPEAVSELVAAISALPHLALRGIMVIPEAGHVDAFLRTSALFESVRSHHLQPDLWDTLSMGMSDDFADAIAQGATMVRVGTALFGSRQVQGH